MSELPFIGEIAALLAAVFWTFTVICFESAGRRVGSLAVNLLRLCFGILYLAIFGLFARGEAFPINADLPSYGWLLASGLVGFVIGDLALFRALIVIGGRLSMVIYTSVPIFAAVFDWLIYGATLSALNMLGIGITISGVSLAIFGRGGGDGVAQKQGRSKGYAGGLLLALLGSFGQAGGLILSKLGLGAMSPFAATQVRIVAGIVGFTALFTVIGWWPRITAALKDAPAMKRIALGAVFGPFLGVSFSLMALQYTKAGIAATLNSLTPVFIIPASMLLFKERVGSAAIGGALLAVLGTAVMLL